MVVKAFETITLARVDDGEKGTPGKAGADGKTPYLHTAYSWSADGTDRFMTVYPEENLLLDTNFNNLPQYWTSRAGTVTGTFNGHNVIYYDATTITGGFTDVLQQPIYDPALTTNRVLPSHWYTLSFYAKGVGQMTSYVYGSFVDIGAGSYVDGVKYNYMASDGSHVWDLTDGWTRHTYTFKSKSSFPATNVQNVLWRLFKGNEAYICMPKLDEGKIATPYTPSPLDDPEGAYPKFIGTYTDYIADDSTDPTKYTWAKLRGEQGLKGDSGADGKTPYFHQAWADSPDGKTGFSTSYADGKLYVGQYSDFTEADSTDPTKYTWARFRGEDGKGIASTIVNYQASTSGTSIPTGTWLASIPSVAANQYLWTRTTWSYTDNTSANGYSVGKMGGNGAKGDPGATGNGIKSVVASYQSAASGTVIPTGAWAATPPDTPQGQYLWTRNLTTFTDGTTSTSYSVAYSAKDGQKGDKGDPGSDNVPVVTVGTSYPTKPKSGDIFWLTDSDRNVIGYYVYNGSTWVANKIDAKTIAAETFNGLTFNGMTFNGSTFINSFDYKNEFGQRCVGTTTIKNGIVTMEYTIPEVSMQGKVSMSAQGFESTLEPLNNTDLSKRFYSSIGNNLMVLKSPTSYGLISSDDIERTGAETWTMHDPINGDYNTDWNKQFRHCWISGVMVLPAAKFKDYKLLFTLKNEKLWPKKTRFLTLQSLGNPPLKSATIQIEVNGRVSCIANEYDGYRYIIEGANYSLD